MYRPKAATDDRLLLAELRRDPVATGRESGIASVLPIEDVLPRYVPMFGDFGNDHADLIFNTECVVEA